MVKRPVELYLSICAVVISLLAAALSWWQLEVGREHNRLSVRPLLVITPHLEGPGGRNGVYLSNQGLGPAILKTMKVSIAGQSFEGLGKSRWNEILKAADTDPLCYALGWPTSDAVLKVGEEVALLATTKAENTSCTLATMVLMTQKKVNIDIGYASMYEDLYLASGSAQVNETLIP